MFGEPNNFFWPQIHILHNRFYHLVMDISSLILVVLVFLSHLSKPILKWFQVSLNMTYGYLTIVFATFLAPILFIIWLAIK